MPSGRSFYLLADLGNAKTCRKETIASVVLPEESSFERVVAAWSYAVRYSADGLDLPNYKKALALLKKRHPSWIIIDTPAIPIGYDAEYADQDRPDLR